jgi:hypothetical protein
MKKTKFKLILNSNSYRIYTDNGIEYCRFKKKYYPLNEIENVINSYKIGGKVVTFQLDSSTNIINPIFDAIYLSNIGLIWKKTTLNQIITTNTSDDEECTDILLYRLNINGFKKITCPNFISHFCSKALNTNNIEINGNSQKFKDTVEFTINDEIMLYWFYDILIKINSYVVITSSDSEKNYVYTPFIKDKNYINIHDYKDNTTETSTYTLKDIFKNNILSYTPNKTQPINASGSNTSISTRLYTPSTNRRPSSTASGSNTSIIKSPNTTSSNRILEEYLSKDDIDLNYKIFLCYLKYFKDNPKNLNLSLVDILNNSDNIYKKYSLSTTHIDDTNITVNFGTINVETIVVNVLNKLDPPYLAFLLKKININIFKKNENLFTYYLQLQKYKKTELEYEKTELEKKEIEKYISTQKDKFINFKEFLIYNDPNHNSIAYDELILKLSDSPNNKLKNLDLKNSQFAKLVVDKAIEKNKNKIVLLNDNSPQTVKEIILITKKIKTDINIDVNLFKDNLKNTIENFLFMFVKSALFYEKFKNQKLNNIFYNLKEQVDILDKIFNLITPEKYSNNFKSAIINYCISKPDKCKTVKTELEKLKEKKTELKALILHLDTETHINIEKLKEKIEKLKEKKTELEELILQLNKEKNINIEKLKKLKKLKKKRTELEELEKLILELNTKTNINIKNLKEKKTELKPLILELDTETHIKKDVDKDLVFFIEKVFPKIHYAKSFIRDDLIDNIQNLISNCSEYNKIIKDIKTKCNITDINKKLEQDKLILKTLNTTLYNTTTIIKEFLKLIKSNNVYTDGSKVYLMQIQATIENYIKELNKIKNIKVLLSIGTILDNEKFRSCSEYNEILELIKVNKNINETHYLKFENLLDIEQKTLIEILLDIVKVIENKNSNDENSLLMLQKYKNDNKLNEQFKNIRRDFFGIGDKLSNSVPPQTIEATGPVLKITQDQKAVEAAELKAVGAAAAKKKEEEAKAIAKQKVKAIPQSGSLTQKEPLPPQIIEATSPSGSLTQKEPLPPQIIEATSPSGSLTQKEILPPQIIEATSPSGSLTQKETLPPQIIEATSPSGSLTQKQILPQSNETTDKSQIIEATSPSASLTQKQIQPPQAEPIQSKKELPITESIELAEKIIELLKKEEIPTIYAYYFYSNKKKQRYSRRNY